MTQYAQYNPAVPAPSPVIGWYDTGFATYPNLPSSDALLEVTADQWAAHMANPSGWAVSGGALVAYTPPAVTPTLAQQAAVIAAPSGAGAGMAVTCTSNAALSGTYAIDPASQQKMTSIAAAISAGLGVPGGGATFNYPDISGTLHAWTAAEFPKLAAAAMNLVYALDMVIAGASDALPSAAVTIS